MAGERVTRSASQKAGPSKLEDTHEAQQVPRTRCLEPDLEPDQMLQQNRRIKTGRPTVTPHLSQVPAYRIPTHRVPTHRSQDESPIGIEAKMHTRKGKGKAKAKMGTRKGKAKMHTRGDTTNATAETAKCAEKEAADLAALAELAFKTEEEEGPVVSEHFQGFGPEEVETSIWAVEEEFYFLCVLGVGELVATDSWIGKALKAAFKELKNPFTRSEGHQHDPQSE